ncbi:hypothetical protein FIBSPDRAFT_925074 [Athelia psychrophila]|uniref:Uncharacterized protein n=1 Tax=Athelia psychrophila TaxID=1759441 RepID=A0A166VCI1_9AGAM|nr:hypothetical protein FIBSPDRAFT_925074 [Fibularhizoctonia sp. CBS 109695]
MSAYLNSRAEFEERFAGSRSRLRLHSLLRDLGIPGLGRTNHESRPATPESGRRDRNRSEGNARGFWIVGAERQPSPSSPPLVPLAHRWAIQSTIPSLLELQSAASTVEGRSEFPGVSEDARQSSLAGRDVDASINPRDMHAAVQSHLHPNLAATFFDMHHDPTTYQCRPCVLHTASFSPTLVPVATNDEMRRLSIKVCQRVLTWLPPSPNGTPGCLRSPPTLEAGKWEITRTLSVPLSAVTAALTRRPINGKPKITFGLLRARLGFSPCSTSTDAAALGSCPALDLDAKSGTNPGTNPPTPTPPDGRHITAQSTCG